MLKNLADKSKHEEMDGLVWVLNGRVFVRNEMKFGMPPLINPCEGVKLFINGSECQHLTSISERDEIELKPIDTEIDFKLEVEYEEDKLRAYAIYTPPKLAKNIIVDSYPVNKLDVQINQVFIESKKVNKESLINYLKNVCGIVFGINESVIEEICGENKAGRYFVAEGSAAQEPIDDSIEYFFNDSDTTEIKLKEDEQGKVDYKNIASFVTVNPGHVIAKLYQGSTAANGIAVDGTIIKARQPKRLTILPTYSAGFDESSGEIRAIKSGRPTKQVKGDHITFQIYDTLSLEEVSIKTGNIKFKGDIEIKENVHETMEVIAKQNVVINGNVNFANVFAGNNISIKGAVISSKINAAMSDTITKDPAPLMENLIAGINRLIDNINSISIVEMAEKKLRDIPEIVRFLMNGKNKDLPGIVYDVLNSLRKGNYDIEEDFIMEFMKKTRSLMGSFNEISNVQYLNSVVNNLKALFTTKDVEKAKGNITLGSVLNSEITAFGDIVISGKGSFNSMILSNGKVTVEGNIRGGQVRAEKGIDVGNAGSEMGVKTLLSVPENSYINIKTANPDTTIKIGTASYTFLSEKRLVRARLVNGKIEF